MRECVGISEGGLQLFDWFTEALGYEYELKDEDVLIGSIKKVEIHSKSESTWKSCSTVDTALRIIKLRIAASRQQIVVKTNDSSTSGSA